MMENGTDNWKNTGRKIMKINDRRGPKSRKSGSGRGRGTLFLTCRAMSYQFLEEFGQSWRQDAQSRDGPRWWQDGHLGLHLGALGSILASTWLVWGGFWKAFGSMLADALDIKDL